MSSFKPIKWEAEIILDAPTDKLKQEVANTVEFPENKTPDLMFFHGIMVSTGTNLNDAHFLGSEIVKADNTIDLKALDMEHTEDSIVGHIYSHRLVSHDGASLNVSELKDKEDSELDGMQFNVHIAGIVYKSRFPELAEDIKDNKWKLSMETYFEDYDIKVGEVIMTRNEAEALGLAADNVLGKVAKLLKNGQEVARGEVARVLRGLMFSGCGIVKNPAEPRAIILETAKQKGLKIEDIEVEFEDSIEKDKANIGDNETEEADDEKSGLDSYTDRQQTSVGICVSYKKHLYANEPPGPDTDILQNDWCALYEEGCASPSRGADDPRCLRNIVREAASEALSNYLDDVKSNEVLYNLQDLLEQVNK